ncbi:MAG: hypothetical protein U0229_05270 [Anaeromyxobacter sp.]
MSMLYIGDLRGFDVDGGDVNGHLPPSAAAGFPPVRDNHFHGAIQEWAHKKGTKLETLDFDAYVARVTKQEALEFFSFCYEPDAYGAPPEKLGALRESLEALPADGEYGVVSFCY